MNNQQADWYTILTGFGSKSMDEIGLIPFVGVMTVSLFSAFFISLLYVRFYRSRSTGSMIYRAFPLLGMSITAIFITIQFSLPLSLGLLGALSIVRFRTPIKEPEEIGFIMLVVATSLCCATFNLLFLVIIHCCALAGLLLLRFGGEFLTIHQNDGMVILEMPENIYAAKGKDVFDALEQYLSRGRMDSISENHGSAVVSYSFKGAAEKDLLILREKVSSVDSTVKVNIYHNSNPVI